MNVAEKIGWRGKLECRKFWGDDTSGEPFEIIVAENILVTVGKTYLLQKAFGQGSTQVFDVTHCYIGVGTGTAAADVAQTDLQGATKTRKIVDSAAVITGDTVTVVSTFTTSDANHAWEEAGIFNASTAGTMLNRVAQTFGAKTAGMSWVMTGTLQLV